MSRVAKLSIIYPESVSILIHESYLEVSTKAKVVILKLFPGIVVTDLKDSGNGGSLVLSKTESSNLEGTAMIGTFRQLIHNMIVGLVRGFERRLTLVGVGYKAQVSDSTLTINVGFSHPVIINVPPGIKIETPLPTEIIIKGSNKQEVGQMAAKLRSIRPPEPYKGKGIRYIDEKVIIKETKKK